jgi:hypothetical protein
MEDASPPLHHVVKIEDPPLQQCLPSPTPPEEDQQVDLAPSRTNPNFSSVFLLGP